MLHDQVDRNNNELISFLMYHTDPGLKVAVDFIIPWGEPEPTVPPFLYIYFVGHWSLLMCKAEVEVVVQTTAFELDWWVDYLVSTSFRSIGPLLR